ncbi:Ig-like domain-containing protein [Marinoscillum furvescens]|uniref:Ig-like domain-containing protein n=1 Tax=Marinoscillum furvescens TaxID=1026 RepID=UPI001C86EF47|nr:Ig-like domain-containing protein [Marinoscillum furvescens]
METIYDADRPTARIENAPAVVGNTTPYDVEIHFNEAINGFTIGDITVTNGGVTALTQVNDSTYTAEITPNGAGDISVAVAENVATDNAGNDNTAATTVTTILDEDAPTVDIQDEPAYVNNTAAYTVTFSFNEDVTGFALSDINVGNGTAANLTTVNDSTYTAEITPDGAGDITINVAGGVAQDAAGNGNTAATTATTIYDNTSPAPVINNAPDSVNTTDPFTVVIDFGEVVSGFVAGEVTIGNGSVTDFVNNGDGTYNVTITPSGAGDITIDVAAGVAQDAAGNTNTAATQVETIYDADRPTARIENAPAVVGNASPYDVEIHFNEAINGFTIGDITVTNGGVTALTQVNDSTYTAEITPNGAGDISVAVAENVATDNAGNGNTAATTVTTILDEDAPTVDIQDEPAYVNNTAAYTVTIDFGETVTGFDLSEILVGNGSAANLVDLGSGEYTVEITPDGTGDISININAAVAQDNAGNDNIAASEVVTVYDNQSPSVEIQNAPAAVNATTPYTVVVAFDEVVSGFVASEVSVGNGSVTNFTNNGDGTYDVEITPSGAGDITIDVAAGVAQDAAGNLNTAATTVTTTYDITGPTVAITGQPTGVNSMSPYEVTVDFGEQVTGFTNSDLNITNGSVTSFVDNGDGTFTVEVTPDGNGDIVVEVPAGAAQDAVGNDNSSASVTTIYDTTPPTVAIENAPDTVNTTTAYVVDIQFSEGVENFVLADISVTNGFANNFIAVDADSYQVSINPDGNGDIAIAIAAAVAKDSAGNDNTAATTVTTVYDVTSPAPVVTGMPKTVSDNTPFSITVDFEELVYGFEAGDIVVGNGTVSGFVDNGDGTYTVEITPDETGDITVDIPAGVAADGVGNANVAATTKTTLFDDKSPEVVVEDAPEVVNNNDLYTVTLSFNEAVFDVELSDVRVVNGTASNLVNLNDSTFTVDITPNGAGDISVDVPRGTVVDTAGNPNIASEVVTTLLDTDNPGVEILNAPTIVNDNTSYTVTLAFDEPVTGVELSDVVVANGSASTLTVVNDSTYTVEITPDGNGDITIDYGTGEAIDAAGNSNDAASTVTTRFDDQSPTVTIENAPAQVNTTATYTVTIQFSDSVSGFELSDLSIGNGTASNFVQVDGDTYTVDITPDGNGNITVDVAANVANDEAGNGNEMANTATTVYDITPPDAPTVAALNTNDTTPVLTGAAEPGSTVVVTLNGVEFTTTADASGNWSVDSENDTPTAGGPFTALTEGDYDIQVTSTDAAGNTSSDATTDELTIDTTAPGVPTVTSQVTDDNSPVLTGTADANTQVDVLVNGVTFTTTADASGNWTINTEVDTPTSGGPFVALADGTYDVQVTSTDQAGNTTTDATADELVVDTQAPAVPTVTPSNTADTTPVVEGTAEAGSTVVITINGVTFTTTADASGNWSIDTETDTPTSGGPFTPLSDGTFDVAVTSTDAAGNTASDTSTDELEIDATAPAVPSVDAQNTNDTTPVLTGTAEAGSTVTVELNGVTFSTTADASGNWSIDTETATPDSGTFTPLTTGTYDVSVTSTDAAGNSSSDATVDELVIDTANPSVPTITAITTNDTTPILGGTADAGTTVSVVINGVTFTTTADASGNWSINTETLTPTSGGPFSPLADGTYEVQVTSSNDTGNSTADTTSNELVVDTEVPAVPTVESQTTTDNTPVIQGTAEAGTEVRVSIDGVVFTTTADASGNWTIDTETATPTSGGPFTGFADGTYNVIVSSTDGAGNSSTDNSTGELVIDASAPSVPTVTVQETNDGTPVLSGTADAGTTVTVVINGVTFTTTANSEGVWQVDTENDTPTSGGPFDSLTDGTYDVAVTSTDDLGNATTDNTSDELVINSSAPSSPTVNAQVTEDATPVLSGTADAGTTVTVTVAGVTFTTTADASGNWTIDTETDTPTSGGPFNPLDDDTYEVVVVSTDDLGNSSSDASTKELVVFVGTNDSDGDGVADKDEDLNGDNNPNNDDTDGDGAPNYLDADDDGDGVPTSEEDVDGDGNPANDDTDGDGTPNYLDSDDDGDGMSSADEDRNGDGDATNDDTDGDGTPDYLDTDDDGDGVPTSEEDVDGDGNPANDDTDGDGTPNYLDTDDDGDGIPSTDEDTNGDGDLTNDDCDGDGTPNYLDADACASDSDSDGVSDTAEDVDRDGDPANDDTDGDGTPDYLDSDDDGDGVPTSEEDVDGDGNPANDDTDGDGTPDYLDSDDDGDGIPSTDEDTNGDGDLTNDDCDMDGTPNYLDADPCTVDSDSDGVSDDEEDIDGDGNPANDDTDGDGNPDYLDLDDDGDGIPTSEEDVDGDGDPTNDDTDGDGIPNYLDADDDGDGIPSADEDANGDGDLTNDDCDMDGTPNYLDADDCSLVDSDDDGVTDYQEDRDGDGDPANDDTDGDGTPDYLDDDDDGDGVKTIDEDSNMDGDYTNDDCDQDGTPNYLDADECADVTPRKGFTPDGDGVNDFFYIENIEQYPNNNVQIFNRWGNKVFEIEGYDNQSKVWSSESNVGLILGQREVPSGTYFYLIDLGDGSKPISGFIVVNK